MFAFLRLAFFNSIFFAIVMSAFLRLAFFNSIFFALFLLFFQVENLLEQAQLDNTTLHHHTCNCNHLPELHTPQPHFRCITSATTAATPHYIQQFRVTTSTITTARKNTAPTTFPVHQWIRSAALRSMSKNQARSLYGAFAPDVFVDSVWKTIGDV